jgi:hypothetical protein
MDTVAREALRALFATDQSPLWRSQRPRVIRIGTRVGGVGALEEAEAERKLQAFAGALAPALRAGEPNPRVARGEIEKRVDGGHLDTPADPSKYPKSLESS